VETKDKKTKEMYSDKSKQGRKEVGKRSREEKKKKEGRKESERQEKTATLPISLRPHRHHHERGARWCVIQEGGRISYFSHHLLLTFFSSSFFLVFSLLHPSSWPEW
jgi:hypothetical protein